jgi:predicted tellurium resistance membrane protein TerC
MLDQMIQEYAVPLLTLTALEIVLGIDNIVFIAILTSRLPPQEQRKARNVGLALAMLMRIALLLAISAIMKLTQPVFSSFFDRLGHPFSGKDLILLFGGLFLIAKATYEIHHKLQAVTDEQMRARPTAFARIIVQILLLDLVFSLDSVITAVGMVQHVSVMIVAVVIAVLVMMVFAGKISRFIEHHPSLKMLALSFLLLVGVMLVVEGWASRAGTQEGVHIDKGYIYFAMGFSLFVELLNIRTVRGKGAKKEPGTATA